MIMEHQTYFKISAIFFTIALGMTYCLTAKAEDNPNALPSKSDKPKVVEIDMHDQIGSAAGYQDLITYLRSLSAKDTVIFKLHNYGGNAFGLDYLLNGLETVKAHKIAEVDGPTFSAGAMLTCAMDEVKINTFSWLMYHSGNINMGNAKTSDLDSFMKAYMKMFGKELKLCVNKHILTQQQADDVMSGRDIYVFPEDLKHAPK